MNTYTLSSTGMFFTPGFVRWLVKAVLPFDAPKARKLAEAAWPTLPPVAISNLLNSDYTVVDDQVRVTDG